MERYELVRRSVLVRGMSKRAASREYGVNRRTVTKMVEHSTPPGYSVKAPRAKPKLGEYLLRIEEIMADDESAPKKQRHTATRIFQRLRDECGYTGGYSQVRSYVQFLRSRSKEAFVPLVSIPGEAESDFGEAVVEIAGVRRKAHGFLMVLPCSGVWFLRMYPCENAESFCDGNAQAFRFFGGVPPRVVYDNAGYAVNRPPGGLKGRTRELAHAFAELRSAFLFEADFAAPRKGNEKGSVERKVGALRLSLLVPVPKAGSFEELNEMLMVKALAHKEAAVGFQQEAQALLPLADYEACRLVTAKADKLSFVRFETNSYSVPTEYALRDLLVRATPFKVEVLSSKQVVAVHERSFDKGRLVTQLSHYLGLLERKPRAARTALPVLQAGLPEAFELYRRRVEDGTGAGDRRFVGILRLGQELGFERIARALEIAAAIGAKDPTEIRMLALRETETLPKSLCIVWNLRSGQKAPTVERPPLSEYTGLLAGAGL